MFVCRCPLTRVSAPRSQVVIYLGLVYKVQHHCGVIFQFVAFVKKRKRTVPDIVAAGGRYDHLVGVAERAVRRQHSREVEPLLKRARGWRFKSRSIPVSLGKTLSRQLLAPMVVD